jgi:hypothetical protein
MPTPPSASRAIQAVASAASAPTAEVPVVPEKKTVEPQKTKPKKIRTLPAKKKINE